MKFSWLTNYILVANMNNHWNIKMCKIAGASVMLMGLLSCDSGGGGGGSCNEALSVEYIENKFATEFAGFVESNTTIVHMDGNQGNTYDIDLVAVSRTLFNSTDESLAFSYTVHGATTVSDTTYIAFYLDTDKNMATGAAYDTLGLDALVINAPGGIASGYYLWNGSGWSRQSVIGLLGSDASYYQGCKYSTTIYAPLYNGLSSLYATDVSGIVMVQTINGSDPGDFVTIHDFSSVFEFTVP